MNRTICRIIYEWGVRCFGAEHMNDERVRAVRLVEEAVELAQAVGVEAEQIRRVVEMVYERPPGLPFQELGGVFVTAVVMARCIGSLPGVILEAEVCRCLSKAPEHFARRNREKLAMGLTGEEKSK